MRQRSALGIRTGVVWACVMVVAVAAAAQQPAGVDHRSIEFWSDGIKLSGELFWPSSWQEGDKLPAIILCGGWGSTKAGAMRSAPAYAAQGYFVLAFDYRGWGDSDGRLIAVDEIPEAGSDGTVTVKAQEIRLLVSPWERITDIRAAISWLELEPGVDRHHIGLWGTSFGGGNVVAVAAIDDRVACVCTQVGDVNSRLGWLLGMQRTVAKYPKAEGTPEEVDARYEELLIRLAKNAGQIEQLLREEKLALNSWSSLDSDGLVALPPESAGDAAMKALVDAYNQDLSSLYSILARYPERASDAMFMRRAQRARGLIDPFPQGKGVGTIPPMSGVGHVTHMADYSAVEMADTVSCPVQIIEAEHEEFTDIKYLGGALYEVLEGRVPVERHVFEGITHFEIYRPPHNERAFKLQMAWFNKHLKGEVSAESKAASNDRELIQQAIDAMTAAFNANDVDAYLQYFSDDYTSFHHFDKAGFREFLVQAWQEMEWSSRWNMDQLVIEGNTATVTMISSSGMGTFPVPTTFVKEADGVWRVVKQG
jgi:pimeloyl-ACP methyl ester carboxylesterase/ketosteroid isomerase-like protein